MPRVKPKTKTTKEVKEANLFLYVIIFILLIQTVFLFYKNFNFMKDQFSSNGTEYIYGTSEVDENNGSTDSNITHTGEYLDLNRPVRVGILNGCGKSGLAGEWKSKLRDLKYDIREIGNADKNYMNSIVLSRIKNMKPAFDLAKKLGIPDKDVLLQINNAIVDIDVSLILGKDYKKLK
ncbi:MAG: LytR C-terminal domain-containing protein [Candidatus Delongbacteria bacterium]|jgi:hypothetical protein|nr:LytR C-terminal domain-containing protein [Candidatus Delongbacteria bacterium]